MKLRHALTLTSCWLSIVLFACDKAQECYDSRSCDPGMRCEQASAADRGTCVPCDPTEIPYDGIDNDCIVGTPDLDLDRDGDNAITSPIEPGTDCDDSDPTVYGSADEVCGDAKDNDCDRTVDEPDCADMLPPTVQILMPRDRDVLRGPASFSVQASDDVGLVRLQLFANDTQVQSVDVSGASVTQPFDLPSTDLPDGPTIFRAEATDVKGRVGTATIGVDIDNATGPEIVFVRPVQGGHYDGQMTIDIDAMDPSGTSSVSIRLDGAPIKGCATERCDQEIDTAPMNEGAHVVSVVAFDSHEQRSEAEVTFQIDRTPPTVSFMAPMPNTDVSGNVDVSIVAQDANGGGIFDITCEGTTGMGDTFEFMWDSTVEPNGWHELRAVARDDTVIDNLAGGHQATAAISVNVQNVHDVEVRLTEPQDGWGVFRTTRIHADAVATVPNSTIVNVQFTVDGTMMFMDTQAPYEFTYDFTGMTGMHTIEARATDSGMRTNVDRAQVSVVSPLNLRVTPSTPTPSFYLYASYDIGDVNGDGVVDVVTSGGSPSILNGAIADGQWFLRSTAKSYDNLSVSVVRLGDVEGDGDLDIITLASGSGVYVFANDGRGNLAMRQDFNAPNGPFQAMNVGDLDGDGDLDCVVGGGTVPAVVLMRTGGAFTVSQTLGGDGAVQDILLEDVDDDGDRDIVLGRYGSGNDLVTIYRNDGNGSFGGGQDSFTTGTPVAIDVGDVTGDGFPDIVGALSTTDQFVVLEGNPSTPGQFTAMQPIATSDEPAGIAIGELNGDGNLDVVVTCVSGNATHVFLGAGGGSFQPRADYVTIPQPRQPRLLDLENDGDLDLVASSSSLLLIGYARNVGAGRLLAAPLFELTLEPWAMAIEDMTPAPGPEIAVAFRSGQLSLFENMAGSYQAAWTIQLPIADPSEVAIGNLDDQNGLDIAVASYRQASQGATAIVLLDQGNGNFSQQPYSLAGASGLAIGDVDNDGTEEVLLTTMTTGQADGVNIYQFDGGPNLQVYAGRGAIGIAVDDFNNDGDLDFAVGNRSTDDVSVSLWNAGTSSFDTITYNGPVLINEIAAADVNGDGNADIVGLASSNFFYMRGNPAFGFDAPVTTVAGGSALSLTTGDFNDDGLFDAAVLSGADLGSVFLSRPQGGFFAPFQIGLGHQPIEMKAADLDGDGRSDMAVIAAGHRSIMFIYSDADSF